MTSADDRPEKWAKWWPRRTRKKNVYLFDVGIRQIILPLIWRAAINRILNITCLYRLVLLRCYRCRCSKALTNNKMESKVADSTIPLCFGHISSHFGFFIVLLTHSMTLSRWGSARHGCCVAQELDWQASARAHSTRAAALLAFAFLSVSPCRCFV